MDFSMFKPDKSEHSTISPSMFYRMMACPASVRESMRAPFQPPSKYAIRGTLQHEAVVRRWNGESLKSLKLEDDELNNVDDAVEYLRKIVDMTGATYLQFEVRNTLGFLGYDDIWGTADVDLRNTNQIHCIDWKFGSGVAVHVDDNPQLLGYLLMMLGTTKPMTDTKLFIHLVQPPLDYMGIQEVSWEQLRDFSSDLVKAIERTKEPSAPYNPGDEQCRFCPAKMTCKARYKVQLQHAHDVFEYVEQSKDPTSPIVTVEQLAELYTKLRSLDKYKKQIAEHGFEELSAGREFPGYKLVAGRANRKWVNEKSVATWLKKYAGLDDDEIHTERSVKSPAQIEKIARKLKKDKDFANLIHKPPGKLSMVSESDKRKAVNPNDTADDVFKGY